MICIGGELDGHDVPVPDGALWLGRNGHQEYRVENLAYTNEQRVIVPLRAMVWKPLTRELAAAMAARSVYLARTQKGIGHRFRSVDPKQEVTT